MYFVNEESYARVETAVDEIRMACETEDDYMEWEDVAAAAIEPVFDELDGEQLKMTVSAFIEYINDHADEDRNFALGVRTALIRCLREKVDVLYDEEYYEDYYDEDEDSGEYEEQVPQENPLIAVMREQIKRVEKVSID